MHLNWSTLALQLINFAILVWLLQRFLYRPVLRMVDARRASIAQQYAQARSTENEAKQHLAAIEAERATIAAERASARQTSLAEANAQLSAARAQAEREANGLLEQARSTLAQEREQLLGATRAAAFELGVQITRRLLLELPAPLRSEAWLNRIERYIQGLRAETRSELLAQLEGDGQLTVATALPLEQGAAKVWRERLQQALAGDITITYAVDATLIAGAELRFPRATLSFDLGSVLATLRDQMQVDAQSH